MKAVHQEIIIVGDNGDMVHYLSKLALAILEQAKDVKNLQVSTEGGTEPNIKIEYSFHPAGQAWLER